MKVSGAIFLLIALMSLWWIFQGTPIAVGTDFVANWLKWVFLVVGGYLAYHALKKR